MAFLHDVTPDNWSTAQRYPLTLASVTAELLRAAPLGFQMTSARIEVLTAEVMSEELIAELRIRLLLRITRDLGAALRLR